ncbi:serine/threonine protein kinase family protein [Glycine max]|uniref:non-specific serine/threonine protein kinase n=1 Tax=Glycine max TaxID=3847 RepID=C6ZRM5_SOYBN|nr:serine/threonine protein kinase family protein [Glycine max]ACM89469.1 serine/threonine protein kinase family protein [Glycine max]|eukprot:NP_001238417.1 serine/threonine protein kinase family protein [Glycine max]
MALPLLPPLSSIINTLFFFTLFFPKYVWSDVEGYSACEPFSCGEIDNIRYPFWSSDHQQSYCGHPKFKLDCQQDNVTIDMMSQRFHVIDIDQTSKVLKMARLDLWDDPCTNEYSNVKLDSDFFNYTSNDDDYTLLYDCGPPVTYTSSVNIKGTISFSCPIDSGFRDAFFDLGCKHSINVSVLREAVKDALQVENVLEKGFEMGFVLNWTAPDCHYCEKSGGRCGFDGNQFLCFCKDKSYLKSCGSGNNTFWKYCDYTFVVCSAGTFLCNILTKVYQIVAFPFDLPLVKVHKYTCLCLLHSTTISSLNWHNANPSLLSLLTVADPRKLRLIIGVPLFLYDELEEATNYFDSSKELGEGGFGTVYFGKLRDGRSVAVKRLYENNFKRVAQFMNEIKILAKLVHPNLVKLYGCTSRHSRELLLVYEYIPNGTVADHLHGQRSKPGKLPWHIRMKIAVETASALNFLHHKDVIHRDVKTNNILLDSDFCVKVADFGLSRLFPDHVTHVSTAPQGTPGYVDPEYHQCYQLTKQSDVYSFGVVLVELISSLPAVDITRHRHEINLSNMAINKIHNQALHELVDPTLGFESDFKVRKMINAVAELAFQCLQSSKEMRPSMEEVVETLKDIQSDGKHKSQPEVMDITSTADDVVLLKDDPPPPSPDSNAVSKSTTPNASG